MNAPNVVPAGETQLTIRAELFGANCCAGLGLEARGAAPVPALCRKLVEAAHGPALALEDYRGGSIQVPASLPADRRRRTADGVAVYDGTLFIGRIVERGGRFIVFNADDQMIGMFADQRQASRAIPPIIEPVKLLQRYFSRILAGGWRILAGGLCRDESRYISIQILYSRCCRASRAGNRHQSPGHHTRE
jgi:hypothetical protein